MKRGGRNQAVCKAGPGRLAPLEGARNPNMQWLLAFLESDRARNHWGRWKGVRLLITCSIWWFRFRHHPARRQP